MPRRFHLLCSLGPSQSRPQSRTRISSLGHTLHAHTTHTEDALSLSLLLPLARAYAYHKSSHITAHWSNFLLAYHQVQSRRRCCVPSFLGLSPRRSFTPPFCPLIKYQTANLTFRVIFIGCQLFLFLLWRLGLVKKINNRATLRLREAETPLQSSRTHKGRIILTRPTDVAQCGCLEVKVKTSIA